MRTFGWRAYALRAMRALLFSNLFVAAGAAALTWESLFRLGGGGAPRWALLLLVFGATLVVYNLDRLTSRAVEDRVRPSERLRWIAAHRRLLMMVSGLGGASVLGALAFLPGRALVAAAALGLVSLAYLAPMALLGRRLKEVPGIKVFVVALVWAAVTVGLPALVLGSGWRVGLRLGVERLLFVLAICLPFDVRDLERDRAAGIRTLPAWIGVEATRYLAWGLLLIHALLVALAPSDPRLALLIADALTLGVVAAMRPERGDLYYSLGVDGTMLVQAALVLGLAVVRA